MILMISSLVPTAQANGITDDEMVLRAANWHDLYAIYKQLGRTVDGVVAGAFTDKVSELLAEQWSTVSELERITRRDKVFRKFVLANINEAVTADRASRIESNAATACPDSAMQTFCDQLLNALATAKRQKSKGSISAPSRVAKASITTSMGAQFGDLGWN